MTSKGDAILTIANTDPDGREGTRTSGFHRAVGSCSRIFMLFTEKRQDAHTRHN